MRLRKRGDSWMIDYIDHAGKRQRKALKGISTKAGAKLAFANFRIQFERGLSDLPTEANITLKQVLDTRLADRKSAGSSKGWTDRIELVYNRLVKFFGDVPFKQLTSEELSRYRMHRLEKVGAECVNKELKMMVAAGRLAVRQGKIGKLPWLSVNYAVDRSGREAWSFMSVEEIRQFLQMLREGGKITIPRKGAPPMTWDYPPKPRLWAMVTLLLNTGVRKGEMFRMRWSDVDMRTRVIRIVATKTAHSGRHAAVRHVPMNAALEELFKILPRGNPQDPVFHEDGNLNRDLTRALRLCGLGHYRVHDLRHTFASHLVMSGVPLYTVSKLLGHAKTDMTQRYAHLAPESLAVAVQGLKFDSGPETVTAPERQSE